VYLLLALLFLLPLVPVALWLLSHQLPETWRVCKWARSLSGGGGGGHWCTSFINENTSVKKSTRGPFVDRCWHWMAVLILQRLLMVAVSVFVNMDVAVSLGMMIISLWFLMFQLLARPYKIEWVNTLQTVASACLLGLTILNSTAGVFLSVGFDPVGTPLEQIQQESEILMLLLLVVPPMSLGLLWGREILHKRRAEGGVDEDTIQTEDATSNPISAKSDEHTCDSDEVEKEILRLQTHLREEDPEVRRQELGRFVGILSQQRQAMIQREQEGSLIEGCAPRDVDQQAGAVEYI
jgi:hypothetical protein